MQEDNIELHLYKLINVTLIDDKKVSEDTLTEELLAIVNNPNNTPFEDY